MAFIKKNLLVTGLPGVGKTTLIQKLAERLRRHDPVGFYTTEIRDGGQRLGFELISLDGRKGLLSHVEIKSPYRVGKYRVDVKGFEDFLDRIPFLDKPNRLIILDEIGRMECFSDQFRTLLKTILDSEKWVVATIALKGTGLIEEVKERKDVKIFEISEKNRDGLLTEILREVTQPF
ncbi:MAG: hypothetical protein A2156_12400 [Deltaproteobacteria bacterium RBG_16_48_10]|nr:MAG: hypothetical protein A2156_12400 [Deltaproteobacteria bacterium RBG_16_48_10]